MGTRPADLANVNFATCEGDQDRNGVDFWWDEEEGQDCVEEQPGCVETDTVNGNCWDANTGLRRHLHERPARAAAAGVPGARRLPAGQQRQAGHARALRDVEPDGQHGPARVRLVHAAA